MRTDPPGWTTELLRSPHHVPDKADRVRQMFNGIAARYQLVNTLFSLGRDRFWRRRAVELAGVQGEDAVLDVACGTGDFARAFARAGARSVVGCDFAHGMLARAARDSPQRDKALRGGLWCEADALQLPFRPGSFSIVSCAFGVRNFEDLNAGLAEMHRVLKPGGRAVILEFTRPSSRLARRLYEVYARRVMPLAATLISGDRSGAYRYLPCSVVSFLDAEQMTIRLLRVGFARVTAMPLTLGIVTVHIASRD